MGYSHLQPANSCLSPLMPRSSRGSHETPRPPVVGSRLSEYSMVPLVVVTFGVFRLLLDKPRAPQRRVSLFDSTDYESHRIKCRWEESNLQFLAPNEVVYH